MEFKEGLKQGLSEAIMETFTSSLCLMPVVQDGGDKIGENIGKDLCVSCVSIGFTGKLEGSIIIVIPVQSAIQLVSKMLDIELAEMCQDVFDGIGELANIIAGSVKRRDCCSTYDFEIGIPSVMQIEHLVNVSKSNDVEIVNLFVQCGELKMEVVMYYLLHARGDRSQRDIEQVQKSKEARESLEGLVEGNES